MVNDSVDKKMKSYDAEYEAKVQKLVDNANAEYDKQAKELEHKITDGIEQAKAQAESGQAGNKWNCCAKNLGIKTTN